MSIDKTVDCDTIAYRIYRGVLGEKDFENMKILVVSVLVLPLLVGCMTTKRDIAYNPATGEYHDKGQTVNPFASLSGRPPSFGGSCVAQPASPPPPTSSNVQVPYPQMVIPPAAPQTGGNSVVADHGSVVVINQGAGVPARYNYEQRAYVPTTAPVSFSPVPTYAPEPQYAPQYAPPVGVAPQAQVGVEMGAYTPYYSDSYVSTVWAPGLTFGLYWDIGRHGWCRGWGHGGRVYQYRHEGFRGGGGYGFRGGYGHEGRFGPSQGRGGYQGSSNRGFQPGGPSRGGPGPSHGNPGGHGGPPPSSHGGGSGGSGHGSPGGGSGGHGGSSGGSGGHR